MKIRLLILVIFAIATFAAIPHASVAQTQLIQEEGQPAGQPIVLPDPLTPAAIRELVSTLSDEQVRDLLLERLDAVAREAATTPANSPSLFEFVNRAATGAWIGFSSTGSDPHIVDQPAPELLNFHERLGWEGIGKLFGSILAAIAAGLLVERIVNHVTRRWHTATLEQDHPDTMRDTFRFLFIRLLNDVYGLIAFFIVTRTTVLWLVPDELESFVKVIMINLVVMPRIGAAFIRFMLAPERPEFRLLHTDDASARFLFRHQIGIFLMMGISIALVNFNDLNGVSMGQSRLGFWLNIAVHIYLIIVAWKGWDGLVMMMRGADPDVTPVEEWGARAFPAYVIAVSVLTWILVNILVGFGQFELLQGAPHYKMMFLLTLLPATDTLVRAMVRQLTPPMTGEGEVALAAYNSTKHSYIRVGRVLVFGTMVLIIAKIWGLDNTMMAAAGIGVQFAGRLVAILIILAIGYLVWEVATLFLNRKLAAEHTAAGIDLDSDEPGGGEGGGVGGSRLSSILPMLRLVLQVAIITMTILIALGNLGVDITPLLAGAGVLGIAIGFGAQTLVKDVVSGVFFLFEDAFRVGEYLQINSTVGTVEKISLRSLQLRHHNGPIHTIPFGDIPNVTNLSRDWVIMKLKWTLPFGTDINKIKKLFKEIGQEMMEADYADNILQTFKSQGVYDVDDVGVVIRGKFMTKPGTQWMIRKDVFARVQKKLESNGIEFARREVRVNVPGLQESEGLDEESKNAITAAAAQSAQDAQVPGKKEVPDTP